MHYALPSNPSVIHVVTILFSVEFFHLLLVYSLWVYIIERKKIDREWWMSRQEGERKNKMSECRWWILIFKCRNHVGMM